MAWSDQAGVMVVREDVLVQVGVMVVEREEESQVTGKGGRGVVCQVLDVLAQVEMGMVAQAVGQALVHQTFVQTLCLAQVHH